MGNLFHELRGALAGEGPAAGEVAVLRRDQRAVREPVTGSKSTPTPDSQKSRILKLPIFVASFGVRIWGVNEELGLIFGRSNLPAQ